MSEFIPTEQHAHRAETTGDTGGENAPPIEPHAVADALLVKEIFDCGQGLLPGIALICGSWCDAEDAVSDATSRALDHIDRGHPIDSPAAWIRTVALNLIRTGARRRATASNAYRLIVARQRSADIALTGGQEDLVDAVRSLAPRQREAIVLHYWYDLPIREVALQMTVADGTAKALLHQARAELKAQLALRR
jgi:RNA polymerase sigma factor (sigma-70 family)